MSLLGLRVEILVGSSDIWAVEQYYTYWKNQTQEANNKQTWML